MIIPHYDVSELLEKWNVEDDSIASHPLKMMGSPTRKFPEPIDAEEQADPAGPGRRQLSPSFKQIVLASRPALRRQANARDVVFTGRIFTAKQAKRTCWSIKLGFIEDAIDRAIELAKLDKDDVQVVKYKRSTGLLDAMLFGQQNAKPALDISALAELAVPRAYYLCTWLPGLGTLEPRDKLLPGAAVAGGGSTGDRSRGCGFGSRRPRGPSPWGWKPPTAQGCCRSWGVALGRVAGRRCIG